MIKLFIPFGLTISAIVTAAPCYTDIKDGCGNSPAPIYVKTKSTDQGFCTEYTNEHKQQIVRCFRIPELQEKQDPQQKNIAENNKELNQTTITQIIYNNPPSQQINNYNENNSNTEYWTGYWNGYNNNYQDDYYPNRRPPPPPHNRPQKESAVRVPHALAGSKINSSVRGSASSHNRPIRPPKPHRPPKSNMTDPSMEKPASSGRRFIKK